MRFFVFAAAVFGAGPAFAHTGHLIGLGGHDHWLAAGAIGAAIAIGIWGAMKGKRDEAEQEAEAEAESDTDEPQEA